MKRCFAILAILAVSAAVVSAKEKKKAEITHKARGSGWGRGRTGGRLSTRACATCRALLPWPHAIECSLP